MHQSQFLSSLSIAFKLALKSKTHITMFYFVVALVIVVFLVVEFSARQLATVSLDVGISMIRLTLPFIVVLLAQELFSREFDKKLNLTSLTYPSSRKTWFFSRVAVIFFLCFGLLLSMSLLLAIITTYVGSTYQQATPVALGFPYLVTIAFIALDLFVVVVIASFIAVSSVTPSFVLIGTLGFTLIARSYSSIIELLKSNPNTISEYVNPKFYQDSLSMISFLIPDLGRLDIRMIALYDAMGFLPTNWPMLLMATGLYIIAVLYLSVWILSNREFN